MPATGGTSPLLALLWVTSPHSARAAIASPFSWLSRFLHRAKLGEVTRGEPDIAARMNHDEGLLCCCRWRTDAGRLANDAGAFVFSEGNSAATVGTDLSGVPSAAIISAALVLFDRA